MTLRQMLWLSKTLALALLLAPPQALTQPSELLGNYIFPDKRMVAIGHYQDGSLFIFDHTTSQTNPLHQKKARSFSFSGGELQIQPNGLAWHTKKDNVVIGRKIPHQIRPITWANGDVKLGGDLWLPRDSGRHHVVILVHGAGPMTRNEFREYPYMLLASGLAVLTFDKRGCGESTGHWEPWFAGIKVLASDVAAVAKYLIGRDDVMGVSVMGFSNGAWVALEAAAQTETIEKVAIASGGAVPIWESELYRIHELVRRETGSAEYATKARTFMQSGFEALRKKTGAANVDRLIQSAKRAPWFQYTSAAQWADIPEDQRYEIGLQVWERELSYDPSNILAGLKRPLLGLFGARDTDVPPLDSARALRRLKQDKKSVQVEVLAGADHNLLVEINDDLKRYRYSSQFAPRVKSFLTK